MTEQLSLTFTQIKTLISMNRKGSFNLIKDSYQKPTANIILNGERMNAFTNISGKRLGCLFLILLLYTVMEAQGRRLHKIKK